MTLKNALAALFLTASTTGAMAAPPSASTPFESDLGGWVVINPAAGGAPSTEKLALVHDAAQLKEGKGSLKYSYSIRKGEAGLLVLPLANAATGPISSFHFWIKPDHSASFMFAVGAKNGNRYQSVFSARGGTWQEVSIALSDLVPGDDKGLPTPEQCKPPAPDQIDNVGIIDTNAYLIQMLGGSTVPIDFSEGDHTLLLSPFTANRTDLEPARAATTAGKPLLSLIRPQVDWMSVGSAAIEKSTAAPLTTPGIKASYKHDKTKLVALMKTIAPDTLTGAKSLVISAASSTASSLIVQLEEAGGGKYKATLDVDAGSKLKQYKLEMAEFSPADDSKDSNNKLDLDQVTKIIIVDITALAGGAEGETTLWVSDLHSNP
jgi:hypothetical protein